METNKKIIKYIIDTYVNIKRGILLFDDDWLKGHGYYNLEVTYVKLDDINHLYITKNNKIQFLKEDGTISYMHIGYKYCKHIKNGPYAGQIFYGDNMKTTRLEIEEAIFNSLRREFILNSIFE